MKKWLRNKTVVCMSWLLCTAAAYSVQAQTTTATFSQQWLNKVNFNPAAVMQDPFVNLGMFGRMQWVGFDGAPHSLLLNASGYMPQIKSSVSGSVMGEWFGSTFCFVAKAGYAYHVHLGRMNYLTFGINADFIFKTVAGREIILADPNDRYGDFEKLNSYRPDVDFGIALTLRDFQLGISATNLVAWAWDKKTDYFASRDAYYVFMQYRGNVSKVFGIDPYICAYYTNDVNADNFKFDLKMLKLEAALRMRFMDVFWIGGGYRAGGDKWMDAAYLTAGVTLGKVFSLGYSYDFDIGPLKGKTSGSHEVSLQLRFETTKKPAETSDTPLMFE